MLSDAPGLGECERAQARRARHRLALFTAGLLADTHAKTAHGILRYAPREVVAVSTTGTPGSRANEVVPYARRDVPVVATVREAAELGANVMVVGRRAVRRRADAEWRAVLLEAARAGMELEAGLHTELSADPELAARRRARPAGRAGRPERPGGPGERPDVRVVHTVGSDCAIGKMSVTLELDAAARARGIESAFVATGQTGIAIAGWGIAVDHVISDFISGAAFRLIEEGARRAPLLFVEGQGVADPPGLLRRHARPAARLPARTC